MSEANSQRPVVPPIACANASAQPNQPFDPLRIRRDFPILSLTVRNGKPLAYLDNAATTQKPASVVCRLCEYYQACNANVHRSVHFLAEQATQLFEGARRAVRDFIGAPSERGIIFTRGATESINLVAWSWGRKNLKPGDEIVLTEMEHHSNMVPWQQVAAMTGARVRYVPVTDEGLLDLEAYERLLRGPVRMVAFTHVSNVLGTVNPVREMTRKAHEIGALVLVDAAQSVPSRPVNVQELECDFLAFSGHKMLGPTGIGILYGRVELLEQMDPFLYGGEMIRTVTLEGATWADLPQKFEAGTPHVSGAVGLAGAIEYLQAIGMEVIRAYDEQLVRYAIERLESVPGVKVLGRARERGGAISFVVDGVHPHDMAQFADQDGIAIRAGHLCAQPLMARLGVPAVSRASVYLYNLPEELDRLVDSVRRARAFFA